MASHRMDGRGRTRAFQVLAGLSLAALLALSIQGETLASSATFSGKTAQKAKISFRASTTTVSKLKTTVTVSCLGAYPVVKHEMRVVPIAPTATAKVRKGSFTFTIPAPVSHQPGPKERTTVTGKIRGRSASGSIKTLYGITWSVVDPRTGRFMIEVGSCAAKTNWSAKR